MQGNNQNIHKPFFSPGPVWLLFYSISILILGWGIIRGDFSGTRNTTSFALPAALYVFSFGIYHRYKNENPNAGIFAGIICRLGLIFVLPHFSDDFFRFLWDGRIANLGINPYSLTPEQYVNNPGNTSDPLLVTLFPHLNSISYPTVYPPLLQFCFQLATGIFPDSIYAATLFLKMMILGAECLSCFFLLEILKYQKKSPSLILLYALNPLVIFELSGNLHFEAFMITGILGMFYFFEKNKYWLAGSMLAFSISAKLLPILFIPAILFRLKIKEIPNFLLPSILIPGTLFLIAGVFQYSDNFENGLTLYFQTFEFNAGIFQLLKWFSFQLTGNVVKLGTPFLFILTAGLLSLNSGLRKRMEISRLLVFILGAYFLFASTIHPWYITPLVALSVVSRLRFPVVWSFFLFFTYFSYYQTENRIPTGLIWLEYGCVIPLFVWEFLTEAKQKNIFEYFWRKTLPLRVSTKKRVIDLLESGNTALEIGCGYGGLSFAIRNKGIEVTALDIVNKSLIEKVKPILFDGKQIPFPDQRFDYSLLITVLHHTETQEELLKEAARTGKIVIVMEDIYTNQIQKHLTFFMDSLVNLEFKNHPHSNRNDSGWKKLFQELNLEIVEEKHFRTLFFFRQVIYVLKKNNP